LKTQIAENISDSVIKFNKTPINTGSSGHFDIRKKTINIFYKSATDNIINIFKALKKNKKKTNQKQENNLLFILIFSETKMTILLQVRNKID